MRHKKLREKLEDKSGFVVYVELTGGAGFDFAPVEKFLRAYKTAEGSLMPDGFDFVGTSVIPQGFDFVGIASPTEAAGVGALGSIICAAIHRNLSWRIIREAGKRTR